MFLSILSEDSKERFIELCGLAAAADNKIAEAEKNMIYAYCREMSIEEHFPEKKKTLDEVLNGIKNHATRQEQRIIVFEILGLLFADDEYAPEEEMLMQKILEVLEIEKDNFNQFVSLFNIYKSVHKELCEAVIW